MAQGEIDEGRKTLMPKGGKPYPKGKPMGKGGKMTGGKRC